MCSRGHPPCWLSAAISLVGEVWQPAMCASCKYGTGQKDILTFLDAPSGKGVGMRLTVSHTTTLLLHINKSKVYI